MSPLIKGYILAILSAVAFGLNPLFGIHLYREDLEPVSIIFYRFFFAVIMLAVWMGIRRLSFRLPKELIPQVLIGGIFLLLTCLCWFKSFQVMDSGIAATILFVYPVFVSAIMVIGFGEKLTIPTIFGTILALVGVGILCCNNTDGSVCVKGIIYVLFSALTYAGYFVLVKVSRLKELSSDAITFYTMLGGAVCLFLFFLRCGTHLQWIPSLNALGNLLGLAFFPSFLSFLLVVIAIRYIGPTRAAILGAFEPLTAVAIGILVFSEPLTTQLSIGIILVLVSVVIVISEKKEAK